MGRSGGWLDGFLRRFFVSCLFDCLFVCVLLCVFDLFGLFGQLVCLFVQPTNLPTIRQTNKKRTHKQLTRTRARLIKQKHGLLKSKATNNQTYERANQGTTRNQTEVYIKTNSSENQQTNKRALMQKRHKHSRGNVCRLLVVTFVCK